MRSEDEVRADADTDRRPFSNHSEFDIWADRHCYDCVNDDEATERYCPILNVAMLGQGWPAEWTRHHLKFGPRIEGTDRVEVTETTADDPAGYECVDTCTEFEERRDPGPDDDEPEPEPPPVCDGQLDIIDAYLPTALAELTRQPTGAPTP